MGGLVGWSWFVLLYVLLQIHAPACLPGPLPSKEESERLGGEDEVDELGPFLWFLLRFAV